MPQPRKTLPRYLKHASGKGRIGGTDPTGTRREKLLPGPHGSPESLQAFARQQLALATSPAPKRTLASSGQLTPGQHVHQPQLVPRPGRPLARREGRRLGREVPVRHEPVDGPEPDLADGDHRRRDLDGGEQLP